jgi:hypothetical protein
MAGFEAETFLFLLMAEAPDRLIIFTAAKAYNYSFLNRRPQAPLPLSEPGEIHFLIDLFIAHSLKSALLYQSIRKGTSTGSPYLKLPFTPALFMHLCGSSLGGVSTNRHQMVTKLHRGYKNQAKGDRYIYL